MDLTTKYLGLELPHPLIAGASPLVDDLAAVRQLEDAGVAAIVMHSLFEEQITGEQVAVHNATEPHNENFAEALSFMPQTVDYNLGPDEYLEQIGRLKQAVSVPIVGSLNGVSEGGWLDYARQMEQAGVDALELNVYYPAVRADESATDIEDRTVRMAKTVKDGVKIPVSIKLSPYYTAFANLARRLADEAKVDGLVIFNRLYQPDIDLDELEVMRVNLSSSSELLLRLRWLAVLSPWINCSLAVTGGVHTGIDAVKAITTGAHGVQMVSALLRFGPSHLKVVRDEMVEWMEEKEYESVDQLRGIMNLDKAPDPQMYERVNYMSLLQSWRV